jgi:peptidoglycan/LPS O-acetylase OafA/YrhL
MPLTLLIIKRTVHPEKRGRALLIVLFCAIITGFVSKIYSLYFTQRRNTYLGTHDRIDSLAWGVLLYIFITHYGEELKKIKKLYLASVAAFILIVIGIVLLRLTTSEKYSQIIFHSMMPPLFALWILGVYYVDFKKFYALRTIGYFSYNWYLWHAVFVAFIADHLGKGILPMFAYILISFAMAALTTMVIEEPMLAKRSAVIESIFGEKKKLALHPSKLSAQK